MGVYRNQTKIKIEQYVMGIQMKVAALSEKIKNENVRLKSSSFWYGVETQSMSHEVKVCI